MFHLIPLTQRNAAEKKVLTEHVNHGSLQLWLALSNRVLKSVILQARRKIIICCKLSYFKIAH